MFFDYRPEAAGENIAASAPLDPCCSNARCSSNESGSEQICCGGGAIGAYGTLGGTCGIGGAIGGVGGRYPYGRSHGTVGGGPYRSGGAAGPVPAAPGVES